MRLRDLRGRVSVWVLVGVLAAICGGTHCQAQQQRAWLKTAEPGPRGDYLVWGWKTPQGMIAYFQAEQPQPSAGPSTPSPPSATALMNGVDMSHVSVESIGTFSSNVPGFRPDRPVETSVEQCRPDGPPRAKPAVESTAEDAALHAILIVAGSIGLMLIFAIGVAAIRRPQ